ncbi:MAG: hypothetical protein ACI86H_000945 [bacterium]
MKTRTVFIRKKTLLRRLKRGIGELQTEVLENVAQHRFILFSEPFRFIYDHHLQQIWYVGKKVCRGNAHEIFDLAKRIHIGPFKNWRVPSLQEMSSVATHPFFIQNSPFNEGQYLYTDEVTSSRRTLKLTQLGGNQLIEDNTNYPFIPIHQIHTIDLFNWIKKNNFTPASGNGVQNALLTWYLSTVLIEKLQNGASGSYNKLLKTVLVKWLEIWLLRGDHLRARLPVLEGTFLTDTEKGIWELQTPEQKNESEWLQVHLDRSLEARDPVKDIQEGAVAIDFGTSNTVVASREHGRVQLLRVGMGDFYKKAEPSHYENPTALEFVHFPNIFDGWNTEMHRPLIYWDDFHCSHEAQNNLVSNHSDPKKVRSIMTGLKQWHLKSKEETYSRYIDQKTGTEWEADPHRIFHHEDDELAAKTTSPFDPLELYAYYLGLFINHGSHRLFLDYYMTFPVSYPRKVKEKILASFRKGLRRSIPESLISNPCFENFSVQESSSEPAAYAACALEEFDIEPTEEGVAFAVFDFGGGTSDFDFGMYRTPTEDQEIAGYEHVIEHFGANGDRFLGGENLIENLAYLTAQHNLNAFLTNRIPLTCPMDAKPFPSSEMLLDRSQFAATNSILLMVQLRDVWEKFEENLELDRKPLSTTLLSREGKHVTIQLKVHRKILNAFLIRRIEQGVHGFYTSLKKAFADQQIKPKEINIFLAGNSCRSILVRKLFGIESTSTSLMVESSIHPEKLIQQIFPEDDAPHLLVHPPLTGDDENVHHPNSKTGVAIGLLKLIPGEPLLTVTPKAKVNSFEQAPFQFYVGRFIRGKFAPLIFKNSNYNEWKEFGPAPGGVFVIGFSTSSLTTTQKLSRGHVELEEKSIKMKGDVAGKRFFVKAISQNTIEVCMADSLDSLQENEGLAKFSSQQLSLR